MKSPPRIAASPAASRNIEAAMAQMSQRYALSSDQAAKVRTILEEQARKFEQIANQGLLPQDGLGRFLRQSLIRARVDERISHRSE